MPTDNEREPIITEKRALEILEVKKSTLKRMVKQWGIPVILGPGGKDDRHYYQSHILEIKDNKEFLPGHGVMDRINILAARQNTLIRHVRQIAESCGLAHLGYVPSDLTITSLYETAQSSIGVYLSKRPSENFLESWLATVPLLTEHEYQRLVGIYKGDPHPWRAFYRLTEELIASLNVHMDLKVNRAYEKYRIRLLLCLDRIRFSAKTLILLDNPKANTSRAMSDLLQELTPGSEEIQLDRALSELDTQDIDPELAARALHDEATIISLRGRGRLLLGPQEPEGPPRSRRPPGE